MTAPRHIHLIEPMRLGHGPLWLRYMIGALEPCLDRLTVTLPELPEYESVQRQFPAERLRFRTFPWHGDKMGWMRTIESARRVRADATIFTYLDVVLRKAAAAPIGRLAGPSVWGVWFMPVPRSRASAWDLSWLLRRDARRQRRKQRVQERPPRWLAGAWVCDPLLRERISPRAGQTIGVLPDPWPSRPAAGMADARRQLRLPEGKSLFLHLGVPGPRKGLIDAVAAWRRAGGLDDAVLVRAGTMDPGESDAMAPLLAQGRAILHEGYVPDERLDLYLRACDWVLMPYRHHEGSSSLLSGAAAAGRPVIAPDYGVLGGRVQGSGLGIVFPHLSVDGFADALGRAAGLPIESFAEALRQYSAGHTVADFAAALRAPLGLAARAS
ncbi:MAG: glycosyltransferase [Burkholderiales bacterium]|nr:glycosyltransferase [Burkholderiales bacterium]